MRVNRHSVSLAFAICVVFSIVFAVQAAGDGPPSRTIPFQGSLELDGALANGTYNVLVTLFDDADAGVELFSEPHTVTVSAGKFSLVIGANSAIPDAVLNAAELFAAMSVEGTPLSGRRQIHAAARVMDPPAFRTGSLVTETLRTNALTVDPTTAGLTGWQIAADIEGTNGAIRLDAGDVQLGLHNSGTVYISDLRGTSIVHPFEFAQNGDLSAGGTVSATGLNLGTSSTPVTRIEAGTTGNCNGGSGLATSQLISFPGPAFASPPIVTAIPAEFDDAGCTDLRLTSVSTTNFRVRSFSGANELTGCGCVSWIAIGQ